MSNNIYYRFVSGVCGGGKTTKMIENVKIDIESNISCLVVVKTKREIERIADLCRSIQTESRHSVEIIHGDTDVIPVRRQVEDYSKSLHVTHRPVVLIISEPAWKIIDWARCKRICKWSLHKDESFNPIEFCTIDTNTISVNSAGTSVDLRFEMHQCLTVVPNPEKTYYHVGIKSRCKTRVQKWKINAPELAGLSRALVNIHQSVYVHSDQWSDVGECTFGVTTNSSLLKIWNNATVYAAFFEAQWLYKLWDDIEWQDCTGDIQRIHKNVAEIYYACAKEYWSKSLKNRLKNEIYTDRTSAYAAMELCFAKLCESEDILYAGNKDDVSVYDGVHTKMPYVCHGTNEYLGFKNVASFSACNYNRQHGAFVQQVLNMSESDLFEGFSAEIIYQQICRSGLRVSGGGPIRIFVPHLKVAALISKRIEGFPEPKNILEEIGVSIESMHGNYRIVKSGADRTADWRTRKSIAKNTILEDLKNISWTGSGLQFAIHLKIKGDIDELNANILQSEASIEEFIEFMRDRSLTLCRDKYSQYAFTMNQIDSRSENMRTKGAVQYMSGIVLDIDEVEEHVSYQQILDAAPCKALIYSTFSHMHPKTVMVDGAKVTVPPCQKYRVVLFLDTPISIGFEEIARHVARKITDVCVGVKIDPASYNRSQLFFLPCTGPANRLVFESNDKPPLEVTEVVKELPVDDFIPKAEWFLERECFEGSIDAVRLKKWVAIYQSVSGKEEKRNSAFGLARKLSYIYNMEDVNRVLICLNVTSNTIKAINKEIWK